MGTYYGNPVSSSAILPVNPNTLELSASFEPLVVIAQPCLTSRLRYRSDFDTNKNRRGVLRSQNNPNYQSPAIRIPQVYLDVAQQYYIRVCLVTIVNDQTNCRYIHPYDLEDIDVDEHNDRQNNAVLFPIESDDRDGIKCFPNLRIVKKKADALKDYGDLRVFDSPNSPSTPQLSTPKHTIREFNLDRLQLAFTLGRKTIVNGSLAYIIFACTTQFSDEIEITGQRSDSPTPLSENSDINENFSD